MTNRFEIKALGFKQSRYAFRELANRVLSEELMAADLPGRKGIDSMASILLGVAGLIGELAQIRLHSNDPETSNYMDQLFAFWKRQERRFEARKLVGFSWYPSSTRPANFPARRLTAIAAFLHYYGAKTLPLLLLPLEQYGAHPRGMRFIPLKWLELFAKPLHIYWSYHYQFERHKFMAPRRLIGKERGRILIVNVVLPALLAYAELESNKEMERLLHEIYRCHPRLADNSITRLMEHRLFGGRVQARQFIRTAHRQQALHHFFYDFCDNNETCCSRCDLAHREDEPQRHGVTEN